MKKLTKSQSKKLGELQRFIAYLSESGQGAAYMADNDVTYGWSLYNIYLNASGAKILVSKLVPGTGRKVEHIENSDIGRIWSAVNKGEDYFQSHRELNETHI